MKIIALTVALMSLSSAAFAGSYQGKGTGSSKVSACDEAVAKAKQSAFQSLSDMDVKAGDAKVAYGSPHCDCEATRHDANQPGTYDGYACLANIEADKQPK